MARRTPFGRGRSPQSDEGVTMHIRDNMEVGGWLYRRKQESGDRVTLLMFN